MWQTDRMQSLFVLLKFKALGTLDRRAHHLSYQGGPKSPPHIFFVLTNLNRFDLGTSLKKLCFKPRQWRSLYRSLANGNIPFYRQTDRLTDRRTGRRIYILRCLSSQTSYHCLSIDCLQTVSELYMYISSVSLPISEPYQTLVSLRQSILCGYDNVTFLCVGGGEGAWYAS